LCALPPPSLLLCASPLPLGKGRQRGRHTKKGDTQAHAGSRHILAHRPRPVPHAEEARRLLPWLAEVFERAEDVPSEQAGRGVGRHVPHKRRESEAQASPDVPLASLSASASLAMPDFTRVW
jgi:hypothetical protein